MSEGTRESFWKRLANKAEIAAAKEASTSTVCKITKQLSKTKKRKGK